jgi:CheY-like chemotaxis protein
MDSEDAPEMPLQAQRMEVLGRLAGAVIHDLNNLLTVIQLNAGLIECGGIDGAEISLAAEKIGEASRRASDLTRKVLNFSRGQPDEPGIVNAYELITALARVLEPLVAHRMLVEILPGEHDFWVAGDRSAIEQAIMNLVLNAVDAMPSGGKITISFEERHFAAGEFDGCKAGSFVGITVADEGGGVSADLREQIFAPFFTTKKFGTGMGLAIVNRIARLHGGTVEFESEMGKGSKFRVWLPQSAPPAASVARASQPNNVSLRSRTVLLVEDDDGIRDLTRRLLEAEGLRVLPAATGEDAVAIWQCHMEEVDLLLTDIVLPGEMSGQDVARVVIEARPTMPILYTSGYSSGWRRESFFNEANFLPKPFQPAALRDAVRSALTPR